MIWVYRASGPLVPPLLPGREGMAGNCWAFCVMPPLRTEHSDWCPLWGQMPSFTKMSQGASAVSLTGVLFRCISFLLPCFTVCHMILFHLGFLLFFLFLFPSCFFLFHVTIPSPLDLHLFVSWWGHLRVLKFFFCFFFQGQHCWEIAICEQTYHYLSLHLVFTSNSPFLLN